MKVRLVFGLLAGAVVIGYCLIPAGAQSRFTYDLYVDYAYFDAISKSEENNLARTIFVGLKDMPLPKRILVPGLMNGRTFFPMRGDLFAVDKRCRRENVLKHVVEFARERGIRVYAFADCLRWSFPGTPKEEDFFERRADLLEVNQENSCNHVREGKFASPFNPAVHFALKTVASELGRFQPALDGLLLDVRLSATDLLGYSETARAEFIRQHQVDPIDIDWSIKDTKNPAGPGGWSTWRRKRISELVSGMSRAFRTANPKGHVAVRGMANYYRLSPNQRMRIRQDWLEWVSEGAADEVVFFGDWMAQKSEKWVQDANVALRKANQRAFINPLVLARSAGRPLDLNAQWEHIRSQVAWPHVIIGIQAKEDFAAVKKFLESVS